MTLRSAALASALALVFSACPPPDDDPDAGRDAGVDQNEGECAAPCGPFQKCDPESHECVDLCNPACGVGELCVNTSGTPRCESVASSCSGELCDEGEDVCVPGGCSCLPAQYTGFDTCSKNGQVCDYVKNPVSGEGGECRDPMLYEHCVPCGSGDCGCGEDTRPDGGPADRRCIAGILLSTGFCARNCALVECSLDELCASLDGTNTNLACLPNGVFRGQGCVEDGPTLPDGGESFIPIPLADPCPARFRDGGVETTFTGTCTWMTLWNAQQPIPVDYCRSAGPKQEFESCKTDQLPISLAETCASGLECVPKGRGNDGICLGVCATELSSDPETRGCSESEDCANFTRFSGTDEILGACFDRCDVFSTEPNFGCVDYGTTTTACVPVPATGIARSSPTGDGICVPLLPGPKAEGEECGEIDPFKGAACQSGLLCVQLAVDQKPICVKPCDLGCVPGGGDVPARCATEANAICGSAKPTCSIATSTSGSTMGFCL